jgi:tRNA pseudouridine55 synthase
MGKVGHAGTLDRFATGLLVVLTGSYSRLASYVVAGSKRYRGLVVFGVETDTLDPEGAVVATGPIPALPDLEQALAGFRGSILQKPPAYSAVHVDGRRAYQIALRGGEPELKERRVEISSLELISYESGQARIEVVCSSGTYIRSLARDMALRCGSRAHLRELERDGVGPFDLEDAVAPEEFDPKTDLLALEPEDAPKLGLRALGLAAPELSARFVVGTSLGAEAFLPLDGRGDAIGSKGAVFDRGDALLGVVRLERGGARYECVLGATS